MNKLWFGDNLTILREEIADESVDLIYLDPPFNSNANYNVLFRTPDAEAASAQVEAFRDTWTWGPEAQWAFDEIMRAGGPSATIVHALHSALGDSDMMAYLAMMAQRFAELHRVLKPEGSLYLHCDPTASHYLKILLDAVFAGRNFRSEIIWKRKAGRGETNRNAIRFGISHDTILFYAKTRAAPFARQLRANNPAYIASKFNQIAPDGRRYRLDNLTSPSFRPNLRYEYKGYAPPEKGWAVSRETMERMDAEGRVHFPEDRNKRLQRIRFLDDLEGETVDSLWDDISPINSQAQERLGYPTQKPTALLNRILQASSKPGDTVLDPFCGCGTTVAAAQASGRNWIGIDVAYHAIKVIEDRLGSMPNVTYDLGGIPRDFESAVRLAERDKYQFQWWGNYLIGVQALKEVKKGRDRGIDGQMFFMNGPRGWGRILTSVKGGQNVGVKDVREFRAVLDREAAEMGVFICLRRPTRDMASEAASFGFVQTAHGHLPRLQIVSIEEWFQGARPSLPSLGHVTREAFQPHSKTKAKRPNPNAPEFTFSFPGGRDAAEVVHFNPATVRTASAQSVLL